LNRDGCAMFCAKLIGTLCVVRAWSLEQIDDGSGTVGC
jgi:hypothetical protein